MKKQMKWRAYLVVIGLLGIALSFVLDNQEMFGLCDNIYRTERYVGCLDKGIEFGGSVLYLSFSLIIVVLASYAVSDEIFKKTLNFTGIWCSIAIVLIFVTPAYRHGFFSMDPTKEQVSLWMSVAFVVISLGMFVWEAKPWKQLR
ncbi:MAG: hypothetical protein HGA38_01080 [Candidatus Moranbacteria bacterium]|nr:hypothetical protein [Candidatus Moranbacteria bacterium]